MKQSGLHVCRLREYFVDHTERNAMTSFVKVVKEILNQYCEIWSSSEAQQCFLEDDLGIPTEWLHEALVGSLLW